MVILTRRAWHLNRHTGEVSFPGGRADDDDEDLTATALREAEEEVGLDPTIVQPITELDTITTVSGKSLIVPIVGVVEARPHLEASPAEVDAVLEVPFSELLDPTIYREEIWTLLDIDLPMRFFELVGDTVWGATAVLLRQLLGIATGLDRHEVSPSSNRWQAVAKAVVDQGLAGPDPL